MRVGAQAVRAASLAALMLALGCSADRPPPEGRETPAVAATPAPASPSRTATIAAAAAPRARRPLPPPVAMPGGGVRIDMRGTNRHVRALERQPDGTYKHVCADAPEMAPAGGSR